jgi:hypothetical protein
MKSWQEDFEEWGPICLLGIVTGIVAFLYLHVFAGELCGDDNTFHFAEMARLSRAMRSGDFDWWNPGANSGFASAYYYQVLPQALPAAISALTGLSPLRCFQLGIFVPLVLAPAAAYRAMRVVGASPWSALGAAIAVPFAISNSRWGHNADGTFWVGLYTQLWAFVAFPLALAHASRWIDEQKDLAPALGWGLFVGLCHPFAGIALGIALAVGTPWVMMNRPRPLEPLVRLGIFGVLLVIGAACAWLPVLVDYAGFGGFPHRVGDEVGPGFKTLAKWLLGGHLLDEGRLPVLTFLLVPVGALAWKARQDEAGWLPRLWATAIFYALYLGIGPHLPKIGDDDLLPAVRFLGSLQIVLAMIAGGGTVVLVQLAWRHLDRALAGSATTVAIIGALVVLIGGARIQKARVRVAADFPGIARNDLVAVIDQLRDLPPGRIQVRGGAENHWAIMLPYIYANRPANLVMGGAALQSSPNYVYAWEFRDENPERAAWIFDAPLVLLKKEKSDEVPGQTVIEGEVYEVHELPAPGLVSPVRVTGTLPAGRTAERAATVEWLQSEAAMHQQVLAHHGSGEAGPAPHGRVADITRGGSWIRTEVEVDDPGDGAATTFVIRESWHPRWTATLDGKPVTIRRVTPDYMAIDVPPGSHTIELRFERGAWAWLLWLLWPGLVAAAWWYQRRTARPVSTAPAATAS